MLAKCVLLFFFAVISTTLYRTKMYLQGMDDAPWLDSSLPLLSRVDLLVGQMTEKEKLQQLLSTHLYEEDTSSFLSKYGSSGFGVLLPCPRVRNSSKHYQPSAAQCMQWRNYIQSHLLNKSRLRLPVSFREEVLHSAGIPGATVFPMPANLGASWNRTLVTAVYAIISREARAGGVDYGFGPVLQVATNALWGRNQEAFGADPFLVTHLVEAATRGLQGKMTQDGEFNKSEGIICQAKHFAAYGHMSHDTLPVELSETTLREVYFRPWQNWVNHSGGHAVMVAHPPLNGLPLSCNSYYLTDVLRNELAGPNHPLTLASDGSDVSHLHSTWRVARSLGEAGVLAMEAGLDQELQTDWSGYAFEAAVANGLLKRDHLERAVKNVLRLKFMSGLFDEHGPPMPDPTEVNKSFQRGDARRISYEAAVQGSVLLVNRNDSLPLEVDLFRSVLLLGPNAGCDDGGGNNDSDFCSARFAALGSYYAPTKSSDIITLQDALRNYYSDDNGRIQVEVMFRRGASTCFAGDYDTNLLKEAIATLESRRPELVLLGLGDNSDADDKRCQQCGEGKDRTSLDLSGGQLQLLIAVLNKVDDIKKLTGKLIHVVVVLLHGRPVTFNGAVSNIDSAAKCSGCSDSNALLQHPSLTALIAGWRPGPFGGVALWNLIRGSEQFAGKLARPWPRNAGQVQSASAPWFQKPLREGGIGDSYAFLEPQAPLFSFATGIIPGTHFVFTDMTSRLENGRDIIRVTLNVRNIGTSMGSALVALFYSPPIVPSVMRYARRLINFDRVLLTPQQSAQVSLKVVVSRDLSRYDSNLKRFVVDLGTYGLHAGDCCVTGVLPRVDFDCLNKSEVSTHVTI